MHSTHKQHSNTHSGFTLIETLVSLLMLSIVLIAATGLVTRTMNATTISQDRFTAAKLAAEGIELIKAKRSRNITFGASPWTQGLVGDWEPDSTQETALNIGSTFLVADPATPRVLCRRTAPNDKKGKYAYSCDTDAEPLPGNFTRTVSVRKIQLSNTYSLQVDVTVTWNNGSESLEVSTVLYEIT